MPKPDPWAVAAEARSDSRWRRLAASWNSVPTQALIDAADPAQGSLVLDLAAGSGDPAIDIALRVSGVRVVALDRSGAGLVTAQQVAQNLGIAERLWFAQADVHRLPLPDSCFDRVTCRCGIMFFDETHIALREALRVLKPGGRAAFLAWGSFEQPFFESTLGTVLRLTPGATLPEAAGRMFRFARAGSLEGALREAGFRAIDEKQLTLSRVWAGSPQELWEYQQEVGALFQPMFQAISAAVRPRIDEAVWTALSRFQDGDTIAVPVNVVLATGES
jgi:ubiquinone/menaquinone biosynthesis C-methylase UbiE